MLHNSSYMIPHNEHNKKLMKPILEAAKELDNAPIVALCYTDFMDFYKTGSRNKYEEQSVLRRKRLCAYASLALWEDDKRWLDLLCDTIYAILDEFTWAYPAHVPEPNGKNATEIATTIDLFASETAFALSEIYHMFSDRLPVLLKERIVVEITRRILMPYHLQNISWGKGNWSAVCASGVTASIIYLDRKDLWDNDKERLYENFECYLDSLLPDGTCSEGVLYWQYGFSHFCAASELIEEYTKGKKNFFASEKVKNIAMFAQKMQIEGMYVVPFSDAPHTLTNPIGLAHFLHKRYPDVKIPSQETETMFGDDIRYRFVPHIRNFFWYDESVQDTTVSNKNYYYLPDSAYYMNNKHKLYFAAKGGTNDEPHNHCDLGSFVLFYDGKYLLDDLGWPEYDRYYFDKTHRYGYLCASSQGHSVPILSGRGQLADRRAHATVLSVSDTNLRMDLTSCYQNAKLRSFWRSFILQDDKVTMTDSFSASEISVTERFVTRIPPKIMPNGSVKIANLILSANVNATISEEQFAPRRNICKTDMLPTETAYLIDFDIGCIKESGSVSFTFHLSTDTY